MKKLLVAFPLLFVALISHAQSIFLTTSGGSFTTEKWVSITTGANGTGTVVWAQGNGTYGNSPGLVSDWSIDVSAYCGTTLYINAYDKYDDGWDGTTYEIWTAAGQSGTLLANNTSSSPSDGNDDDDTDAWGDTQAQELEVSESFTAPACPCTAPSATYTTVADCGNSQFTIDVVVSALGDASGVDISDGVTTFETNVGTGTYNIGPFAAGSNKTVTVNGTPYSGCSTASSTITEACACATTPTATVATTNIDCGGLTYDIQVTVTSDGSGDVNKTDIIIDGSTVQTDATTSSLYTFTVALGAHTVTLEAEGSGFATCTSIDYNTNESCDNDECSDAFGITVDGPVTTSLDVTTYSSSGNNLSCDGGSSNEDAYYSFVAPASGSVIIEVDNSGLSGTNTQYVEGALYANCADAGTNTEITCFPWSNDLSDAQIVSGLTGGLTYYLEIEHYNNDWTGTYTVSVKDATPTITAFTSACWDLSTAIHMYDLGDGGDDYDCGFASIYSGSTDDQVAYLYTPASNETIDLIIDNVVTSSGDFAVSIFDNTSGTPVSCLGGGTTSADVTYSSIALTGGTEYIIMIGGQASTQNSSGCVTIQPQCAPTFTNTVVNNCGAATFTRTLNFSSLGAATNIVLDDADGNTYGTPTSGISTSTDYDFAYTNLSNRTLTISGYNGAGVLVCQQTLTLESGCVSDICADAIDIYNQTVPADLTTANIDGDLSTIAMGNGSTFANCNALGHSAYYHSDFADLWYMVDLPDGADEFTVTVTGSSCDIAIIPYTGTCGSLSIMDISGSSSTNSMTGGDEPFISGNGSFRFYDDVQTDIATASTGIIYLRVMGHDNSQDNSGPPWCDFLNPCSFSISATSPQANDVCSDAINIDGTTSTGNFCAAAVDAESSETGNTCAESAADNDLWYEVTMGAGDNDQLLEVDLTFTNATDAAVVQLYHGCFSNSFEECATVSSTGAGSTVTHQFSTTITAGGFGPTWYVRVIPVASNGICDFSILGRRVAENNDCDISNQVFPTAFTISTAKVVDFSYSTASGVHGETDPDLWYVFDPVSNTDAYGHPVNSTSADVTVSGLGAGEEITLMLYRRHGSSGNCADYPGDYLSTLTITGNGTSTLSCLDEIHGGSGTGDGYVLRILQSAGGSSATPTVTVTPSTDIPPYNNSCVNVWSGSGPKILGSTGIDAAHSFNAYVILDGETVTGDFTGSTDCDAGISSSVCSGIANDPVSSSNYRDMWYVFSVPSASCPDLTTSSVINSMTFTYDAGSAFRDAKLYVYSDCGDGNLIDCSGALDGAGDSWTVTGLSQGNNYLVRVKPYHLNSDFDYSYTLKLDNGPVRPCNNEAADARAMTVESCNDYGSLPTWSIQGADQSPQPGVPENDVWFTFTAPSPANGGPYFNANKSWVTVFFEHVSGASSGPLSLELFDAPASVVATAPSYSTTTIAGSQEFAHFGHLNPGQTYYLRLYSKDIASVDVRYKINVYTPDVNSTAWACGQNSDSQTSGCSEGCSDLREAWYKIDLPEGSPSNLYWMIEVVGEDQILDFELRSQYLTESSATEGDIDDYDLPCSSRPVEPGVSMISETLGITSPTTGESCNPNAIAADGGSGVRRVYQGMNGPAAGMKDYYYIKVFQDPSDPNYATSTGVKICAINFFGPYSTSALANAGGVPDEDCTAAPCTNATPTGSAAQTFCSIDSPTIADLVVTGGTIVWYDASSGGTAYASTDALTNGTTYYAADETAGCDPSARLAVTVTIDDPAAPTGSAAQSFCAIDNPTVANLAATGTSIQWYAASTGGTALLSTDALTTATTYYASQIVSGCESDTRLAVTVTIDDPAAPTGSAAQSFCAIDNPTVADLAATGSSIQWYAASTGGTALLSTDALTTATTYYASQTVSGCESDTRLAVTVTIDDPAAPTGSAAQSFCAIDNPTVADLVATGTSIQWYAASTGGTALLSTNALTTATTYYASQIVSGCESDTRLAVTVTIDDPAAPTGSAAQSFCAIDNPTVADLAATGSSIQWYAASTGGTALLSTDALTTATTYYASQTVSGCESDTRLAVTVTIDDPAAPTGSAAQSFCAIDNPTVADLAATGTSIQWYAASTGGTALLSTDALTTATTYYASQTVSGCESDTRLAVTVTIDDPAAPTGSAAQSFCAIDNPTVADLVATGTSIQWYAASTGGTALLSTDALTTATTYYASQTVSGCESDTRFAVTVTIDDPAAPTGSAAQSFCAIDNPTVADLAATGTSIQWYAASTGGTALLSTDALTTATTYYASQTVSGCESDTRLAVTVTIDDPAAPTGSAAQSFCAIDNPTVADLVATGTTIQWYAASTGGTALLSTDALTTATTYYASQTVSGCESDTRLAVTVTIDDPAAPTGSAAQNFCAIDYPTIADLSATGTTIQWYAASTGGTALLSTDALTTATTYYASQTVSGCESDTRFAVTVTIDDPAAPTGSAAQSFCAIDNPTVADLVATGTTIQWYAASTGGTALLSTDALTTATTYYASQTVSGCESDTRLAVTVTIDDPAAPTGSATQTFCAIDNPTVADLAATGTSIQWYAASTGGTALLSTHALITATTYYASQTVSGCESDTRFAVIVTLDDPGTPIGSSAQNFCVLDNPTIADLLATGTNLQWFANATGGTALLSTDALVNGTTYYAASFDNGCESTSRLGVTVTISNFNIPNGDTIQTFCSVDGNFTVGDLTVTGSIIEWYADAGTTTQLNLTDPLSNNTYYYALEADNSGSCPGGVLEVFALLSDTTAPSISDTSVLFCYSDNPNPTLGDVAVTGNGINWYSSYSSTTVLPISTVLVDGENYFATQTNSEGCESSTRLGISVTIQDTVAPTISDTSITFCLEELASPNLSDIAVLGNNIQWYADLVSSTPLPNSTILINGEDYYASQTTIAGCESSTRLGVTVNLVDTVAPSIADTNVLFCLVDNPSPTLNDVLTTGNNLTWYADVASTTPLSGTTVLTDGEDYYATQQTISGCESSSRLAILVSLSDTLAPIVADTNITFCLSDISAPTLNDVVISGNNVMWYDELGATSPLPLSTVLIDGEDYFASQTNADGCESSTRLAILVALEDTVAPTIADTNVLFCLSDNPAPTLSDVPVSGSNITWYAEATHTTILASTTALIDGEDYYATQSMSSGCESTTDLAILVTLSDTVAPLTSSSIQQFCQDAGAVVSDLDVQGNSVSWYMDASQTIIASGTDPLQSNASYFATQVNADGCESSLATQVDVTISSPVLDTTSMTMTPSSCNQSNGSLTNVSVSGGIAPYTWEWSTGGIVVGSNQDLTGMPAGVYDLVVTDAIGCMDTIYAIIISDDGAAVIDLNGITVSDALCDDQYGDITGITTTGGNLPLSYEWTNGAATVGTDLDLVDVDPGTYSLTVTDANGCVSNAGPFTVEDLQGPSLDLSGLILTEATCFDANGSITGITVNGNHGPFTVEWSSGGIAIGSNIDLTNIDQGNYVLSVTDTNNCLVTLDTVLTADPSVSVTALNDTASTINPDEVVLNIGNNDVGDLSTITIIDQGINGNAIVDMAGNMTYTPNGDYIGMDSVLYSICDEFCVDICTTAYAFITIDEDIGLHVPNGFSPNGDGFNDLFIIEGLDQYPNNEIIIFNRWGDMVFEAKPYENNWDGTTTNSALHLGGDQVTEGTYFFILNLNVEGMKPINGFVELRRK